MTPCYFALDCIPTPDGRVKVLNVYGGVGGGLAMLAAAYGGQGQARARLRPYLEKLGEVARSGLVLFVHDPFVPRQTFPDDFFTLVQRYSECGPITDWVPDLQAQYGDAWESGRTPEVEQMGMFLDPLASRLRLKIAYCTTVRVDRQDHAAKVLLSGYRERARRPGTTVILAPQEIGVAVYSGYSDRFPDDFKGQDWFPVVNPPLLDRLLESRWLLAELLKGTRAARLLPRWVPVGMGFRTSEEVRKFGPDQNVPAGFPLAVLRPSHASLGPGIRFLDRTSLRALAARQPTRRIDATLARNLVCPGVSHTYEEISSYRGKLLDNLLRTAGAQVHDHGDGTFHFSAPYPFLECTVSVLREYVEARAIRSRRTGKLHRGSLRVVMFGRKIVAALYRLDQEPDDGTFRDLDRPEVQTFYEGVPPEEEAQLQSRLGPFVQEIEKQFAARVTGEADLAAMRAQWVAEQAGA